jgi:hypothetical protein
MKILKTKNKKWFSLIVAMWLVSLISLLAISILSYIVPFSKGVKGIENSSKSYYEANSWLELALFDLSKKSAWYESGTILTSNPIWNSFNILGKWNNLPPSWKWNSEFDSDWNIVRSWNPIQLEVWDNIISDWSNLKFYFRVPNLDSELATIETLSWSNLAIINWQLSSNSWALNSSWTYVEASDICDSKNSCSDIIFTSKIWSDLSDTSDTLSNFYNNQCGSSKDCNFKLSIVNKLETTSGTALPYLEWKVEYNSSIPLRYFIISSKWKSYWFKKELNIRVPQKTVNDAFDFTVFQ